MRESNTHRIVSNQMKLEHKKMLVEADGWWRRGMNAVSSRLAPLILRTSDEGRRRLEERRMADLRLYLQSCGADVRIHGPVKFTDPRSVTIGNRARIEPDGWFATEGGLTIGDGAHIGRGVLVETVRYEPQSGRAPRPIPSAVAIGRNAYIGARATILPGVRIGEGAVVYPGVVVTQNVPSGSSVIAPPSQVVPGSVSETLAGRIMPSDNPHWDDPAARVFFVVGAGRSGTLTMARMLSQHPLVDCLHEPRLQMIRLSTELAHSFKTAEAVKNELRAIFCESSTTPANRLSGESDQDYWNLILILAELMPQSRFVWLIRDGRDVVSSTVSRKWYSPDEEQGDPLSAEYHNRFVYYRVDGSQCGVMPPHEWRRLSPFDKNCWHWSYINNEISRQLSALPREQWMQVRLEDLTKCTADVFRFLGVQPVEVDITRNNRTEHGIKHWRQWSAESQMRFAKWCGMDMDRWYPDWQNKRGE